MTAPTVNLAGSSLACSTKKEPSRPCGRPTRPTATRSVDDLDKDAVARPRRARTHDRAQGAGDPALAADEFAVARGTRVGSNDAVDRVLLRADPRQPQLDCHLSPRLPFLLSFALGLSRRGRAGTVRGPWWLQSWQGRHLAAFHLLHHLRHLLARLQQLVDLLDVGAAALRDS